MDDEIQQKVMNVFCVGDGKRERSLRKPSVVTSSPSFATVSAFPTYLLLCPLSPSLAISFHLSPQGQITVRVFELKLESIVGRFYHAWLLSLKNNWR